MCRLGGPSRAAFDQRLDSAKTGCRHKDFAMFDNTLGSILPSPRNEREHGAEVAAHLSPCGLVPRMMRKSGVKDMFDSGVRVESCGKFERVFTLPLEPDCERLRPSTRQPACEPIWLRANIATTPTEPLREFRVVDRDRAKDQIAVPTNIFGDAVHGSGGSIVEGVLRDGCCKGVVTEPGNTHLAAQCPNGLEIRDGE